MFLYVLHQKVKMFYIKLCQEEFGSALCAFWQTRWSSSPKTQTYLKWEPEICSIVVYNIYQMYKSYSSWVMNGCSLVFVGMNRRKKHKQFKENQRSPPITFKFLNVPCFTLFAELFLPVVMFILPQLLRQEPSLSCKGIDCVIYT